MIHPGLVASEKWEPVEYASGYRARLIEVPALIGLVNVAFCMRRRYFSSEMKEFQVDPVKDAP